MALGAYNIPTNKDTFGGVVNIFVTTDELDFTSTNSLITSIDGTSANIYRFQAEQVPTPVANGVAPLTVGDNGNTYAPAVTGRFVGITTGSLDILRSLSQARGLTVFVETCNDGNDENGSQTIAYGLKREMYLSAADIPTGTAAGDFSGVTFTLSGTTKDVPSVINGTLASVVNDSNVTINV